ncbi:MAG: hypothetical protein H6734_15300 [Alphaproteobacteria bacterium]|nr:hypothetical protein [Alphaproteobacteria bacterium]
MILALLGGSMAAEPVGQGTWSAKYAYHRLAFITREHTEDRADDGEATLVLGPDGAARMCVRWSTRSASRISAYAPGGASRSDDADQGLHAFWGRWEPTADGVALAFDHASYTSCDDPEPHDAEVRLAATRMEGGLLACELPAVSSFTGLALRLDGSGLVGVPWHMQGRNRPEGAVPRLVLGSPGVRLTYDGDRGGAGLTRAPL